VWHNQPDSLFTDTRLGTPPFTSQPQPASISGINLTFKALMICAEATRRSRNYAPNDQKDWHKAHRSAFCRQNHAKAGGQACCANFDGAADDRQADHRAKDDTHRTVSRIAD
jgi:hypothetical protein